MHPSPARRAATALAAASGVAVAYGLLVRTRHGQEIDDRLASAAGSAQPLARASRVALYPYRRAPFAVATTALGVAGLAHRGPARTACASLALLGTLGQVEQLKASLDRPALHGRSPLGRTLNSYPSGHTAGVAALTAMAVVLAPERTAPLGIAGGLATAAVGLATVGARWHRPSDVVGAALSAVQWGAIGLAAADAVAHR